METFQGKMLKLVGGAEVHCRSLKSHPCSGKLKDFRNPIN